MAFSPDGKTFLTGGYDQGRGSSDVPELPDDLERVATWVEVLTGLALDARQGHDPGPRQRGLAGAPRAAGATRRPAGNGGRAETRSHPFGIDPPARGRVLMQRERWDEAEAAFDEVVRARPYNASSRLVRGELSIARSRFREAAEDFARAEELSPTTRGCGTAGGEPAAGGRPGRLPLRLRGDAGPIQGSSRIPASRIAWLTPASTAPIPSSTCRA